ncbi:MULTISPECIES: YifB family Mg chelatase-like AAA ATPase [Delftia]|uniref:YifB family Mg chelatase-like AAA ATPase n=1 Tax=Delftia tsuruhatensis TaxID=180282 RepID=A0AAX3SMN6_9BURK|nr:MULTISPECIES: YifB family Mg chelatase-like AAA ATPase [Delftia]MDH0419409.1 YifB family Mg chelatase-like AAA ATPase [Delftia tsuruhatensis]OJX14722.1 MAG: ATP-dependent protease [Delftia sp. 67-8]WFF81384.1 YifB family Mg chelatase-like AAA ATPase [Delftia tsuruhatensis]WON90450.1 YifB family Mg chelatase-like AAA ATPase [Delftia sp. UGAL515B_04]
MGLALVQSRALLGLAAPRVTVEVHLANGLPSFTLVGLADVEVKEARERVRSALLNSGLEFPSNKRIIVNLAPADLPKDSGRFDLPIALGILAASGQINGDALADYEFAGELSLSGALRPVRGALATALALHRQQDGARLVLPPGSAQEAAFVPSAQVFCAHHLLDVVRRFITRSANALVQAEQEPDDACCSDESEDTEETDETDALPAAGDTHTCPGPGWHAVQPQPAVAVRSSLDLAEVRGQAQARRALEIAAAGGHGLLLVGPPGSGKSMLAQRFADLLPPMSDDEALEAAAIASLAGRFTPERWRQRPTASPHHTASAVALVGGGSPPRPGEISQSHHGVLFLDEFPEFARSALEALREPLETGQITIARAAQRCEFPARFQLVAAMNPCPCGHWGSTVQRCRCTPDKVARYQARISGPLLDRIDLHVEVGALPPQELLAARSGEASDTVRERVVQARALALQRQGSANHQLQGQALDDHLGLSPEALTFAHKAAARLGWSARSTHRALKVARTIADLAGSAAVETGHVAEAMQYRRVLRLPS